MGSVAVAARSVDYFGPRMDSAVAADRRQKMGSVGLGSIVG